MSTDPLGRMLAMLRLFEKGGAYTADELAERFGCSVLSARRSLTAMKKSGRVLATADDDARRARYVGAEQGARRSAV